MIRIKSDGTPMGTRVLDKHGKRIEGITSLKIEMGVDKEPKLTLNIANFEVDAEFIDGNIYTYSYEERARKVISDGGELRQGDYCLGTRWSDGSNKDPWAIGILGEITTRDAKKTPWFFLVDNNGQRLRPNGFRRVVGLTREEGDYILNNTPGIDRGVNSVYQCLSNYRAGLTHAGLSR